MTKDIPFQGLQFALDSTSQLNSLSARLSDLCSWSPQELEGDAGVSLTSITTATYVGDAAHHGGPVRRIKTFPWGHAVPRQQMFLMSSNQYLLSEGRLFSERTHLVINPPPIPSSPKPKGASPEARVSKSKQGSPDNHHSFMHAFHIQQPHGTKQADSHIL